MKQLQQLLVPLILLGLGAYNWTRADDASSTTQTLQPGQPLPRIANLTPSSRIYLRYKIVGDRRETVDLWRREISFEPHDGHQRVHVFWRWDSVGERKFSRLEDSWFESSTFRPLTVQRRLTKDGNVSVQAFRYSADRIEGLKELPENDKKDFLQLTTMPVYNFEMDMELLQALPLASGYRVRIPFYEAGEGRDPPQYYEYRVIGEDKISSADGSSIDCWIVGIESENPDWGPTRMWFSKGRQIMIREQTRLKDGTLFVKMLLAYDDPSLKNESRIPS